MNNEEFNIEFFDEKIWAKGDTGETPIVTIDASVDNTVGTPSVDVNKTGDAEHPHFDIDFKHIKGEKGNTGATPNMTLNATVNQTIGEASVEVEKTGTPEHPRFDIAFSGVKGEKGDKGDTGYTPNIEVGASVDNTVGTPNVTVSKTGTPENPRLEFDFKHLKGVKGEKGDTGSTPNISMSATVGQSIGTPSVNVSKSGSAENPSFTLAFNNIKGEKGDKGDKGDQGDDGLDGFASRLTKKITPVATDYIPINEADGTAKCINYATMDRLLNSWDDMNYFKCTVSTDNIYNNTGISAIADDNGKYTINGTVPRNIYWNPIGYVEVKNGVYFIEAEAGASVNTHEVRLEKKNKLSGENADVANIISDRYITISDADDYYYMFSIVLKKDYVCNNLKMKPNLVLVEAADGTKTNKRLADDINTSMGIEGNLIKDQEPQTIENNGITFSVESDGSFTVNGTATAEIRQTIGMYNGIKKGDIIIVSGAENFKDSFVLGNDDQLYFNNINGQSTWRGAQGSLNARTVEITTEATIKWNVAIGSGHTYDNFKVYPSIHIIGKKEVETAYTNKELGDRIEELENKKYLPMPSDTKDVNTVYDNDYSVNNEFLLAQSPNLPSGTAYMVSTFQQNNNNSVQLAMSKAYNSIYIRAKNNGTWSNWQKLIRESDLAAKKPTYTTILTTNEIIPTTFTSYECADFSQCDAFLICAMYYGAISATIEVPMVYFQFTGESNSIILKNPRNDIVYRVAKGADNTHIIVKAETEGTTSEYKVRVYGITY